MVITDLDVSHSDTHTPTEVLRKSVMSKMHLGVVQLFDFRVVTVVATFNHPVLFFFLRNAFRVDNRMDG